MLLLIYPTLLLGVCFLVPFALILAASVATSQPGGAYQLGFELTHYQRFIGTFFIDVAWFSVGICALVAVLCVTVALPFTYFITRLRRRFQVVWLVLVLAQLSLSEVLIAFGWQVLLSRTAGLSNLLVWLGLLEQPVALYPGFGAVLVALVYLGLPFAILMLYPPLSRLDRTLDEASRTLGATPLRTFFTVVIPQLRPALIATVITLFVFTLGAVLIPQVLGRPSHWTLSVLITDQAIFQSDLPFAAALAVFLLALSLALVLFTRWFEARFRVPT